MIPEIDMLRSHLHRSAVKHSLLLVIPLALTLSASSSLQRKAVPTCICGVVQPLEKARKFDEALKQIKPFIGDGKYDQGVVLNAYAWEMAHTQDLNEALNTANIAIAKCSAEGKKEALDTRAYILLHKSRPAEALNDINESLKAQPESPTYLIRRAMCYEQLGQIEQAKEDLHRARKNSFDWHMELDHATANDAEIQHLEKLALET